MAPNHVEKFLLSLFGDLYKQKRPGHSVMKFGALYLSGYGAIPLGIL
jgi:hypothetical protein